MTRTNRATLRADDGAGKVTTMGIRILLAESSTATCLVDSVTDWAFGPVFEVCGVCGMLADDQAEDFLLYCHRDRGVSDLRMVPDNDLHELHATWHRRHEEAECDVRVGR